MGQVLIRNVDDDTVESYRQKAKIKGISLEQELRNPLDAHPPFTPAERVAMIRLNHARHQDIQPALSLDDIRDGSE